MQKEYEMINMEEDVRRNEEKFKNEEGIKWKLLSIISGLEEQIRLNKTESQSLQ